ncbi:MAG: hypothetical protein R3F36_09340 [Candidatus Competibacteraceae bacterium]
MFVLALALALTGIVAGIALRIRAFLYAGVAFLVLNVIGLNCSASIPSRFEPSADPARSWGRPSPSAW